MTSPEIAEVPEEEEIVEYLTPEESDQFKSLMLVGRLSGTFVVYGHKIKLETTTVEEDIQLGMLVKKYQDSYAFQRAYRTAMVAAFLREIDGRPLVQSLGSFIGDDSTSVETKFDKLKEYYPAVIDEMYDRVQELEKKLMPILSRLGKTSS